MLHLKALAAVVVAAGFLALPLYFYSDYLNQGRAASKSAKILNALQKDGIRDFSLPDVDGNKSYSLNDFKGKLILLNFWASWCAPCVKEFPSMINLVKQMNGDLVVVAVSHDSQKDDLKAFIKAFEPIPKEFLILWDKERVIGKEYGTEVLPESYIISPEQKLIRKVVGVETWDHAEAIQFFKELAHPTADVKSQQSEKPQ